MQKLILKRLIFMIMRKCILINGNKVILYQEFFATYNLNVKDPYLTEKNLSK
jgi:hypothetical protein